MQRKNARRRTTKALHCLAWRVVRTAWRSVLDCRVAQIFVGLCRQARGAPGLYGRQNALKPSYRNVWRGPAAMARPHNGRHPQHVDTLLLLFIAAGLLDWSPTIFSLQATRLTGTDTVASTPLVTCISYSPVTETRVPLKSTCSSSTTPSSCHH